MYTHLKTNARLLLLLFALTLTLTASVSAQDTPAMSDFSLATPYDSTLRLQTGDFISAIAIDDQLAGVIITGTPPQRVGSMSYGARALVCGDVIPAEYLGLLSFTPCTDGAATGSFEFMPVFRQSGTRNRVSVTLNILPEKNAAPVAEDMSLETYKNIAVTGKLTASDPDGDEMTYTIISQPKRGTIELTDGATFVYTPEKNKVGKDSFTYTAADVNGNVSKEATVSIKINKPSAGVFYSDMDGDPAHYAAVCLAENNVFIGESIGGLAYFLPDKTVTRGEFLAMTMNMLGIEPDAQLTSGFSDDEATPAWIRPYIASALKAGIVSGVGTSGGGLVFRSEAELTRAEAAVMLSNALGAAEDGAVSVMAQDDSVPAWAQEATVNLGSYGILEPDDSGSYRSMEPVTRADAAVLLCRAIELLEQRRADSSLLGWAMD